MEVKNVQNAPALEIKGLRKEYSDFVLEGMDLTIERGKIMGLVGENGAGKTTAMKAMLGIIKADGGTVRFFGNELSGGYSGNKNDIGVVLGEVNFYETMTPEQVGKVCGGIYKNWDEKRFKDSLGRMNVAMNKKIKDFSKGMRIKLALATALSHQAKILILDEPTSGLDPLMQREFFEILKERNSHGTTVFLSSHVLSEIQRNCTRAAIIREGRLIACDSVEQLSQSNAKRISIHGKVDLSGLDGIRDKKEGEDSVSFLYTGDINKLLRILSAGQFSDISISEPDLEEIFLHYYEKEGENA